MSKIINVTAASPLENTLVQKMNKSNVFAEINSDMNKLNQEIKGLNQNSIKKQRT